MTKAKAKAKKEKLVTRVVVGPKGIWIPDGEGHGGRRLAGIGETIKLTAKSAKAFSRYLEAPNVAKAKAAAKVAEDAAADDEGEEEEEEEVETEAAEKVAEGGVD